MRSRELSPAAIELLAQDAKIGLLASVDADGLPRITLITSLAAKTPGTLLFGQFCEGASKLNVRSRPQVGFLALDASRRWVRGTALWRRAARQGEDFEAYNRKPMFRYNAYFGIHTVHYLDVVEVEEGGQIGLAGLLAGAALVSALRIVAVGADATPALTPWAKTLVSRPSTLKFASYLGADGHPRIVPGIAACTAGRGRLVISCPTTDPAAAELAEAEHVALFALDRQLHSVLVRGRAAGLGRVGRHQVETLSLEWVYNSMPPKHGQVFPRVDSLQ